MTRRNLPLTVTTILRNWATAITLLGLVLVPATAHSEDQKDINFTVSPKRCVTLRQGQPCFVRARFQWDLSEEIAVCVYDTDGKKDVLKEGIKIKCWSAAKSGIFLKSQTLSKSTEYVLTDENGVELKRAEVSVSWVYKKKRSNRRWRLF